MLAVPVGGRAEAPFLWPPVNGEAYPDLELVNQDGEQVRLSSFRGKMILLEPAGMNCPACQAFSGAHRVGPFGNIKPEQGVLSIDESFKRISGGMELRKATMSGRLVRIQILLFGMDMKATSAKDAAEWARHFGFRTYENEIVLAGTSRLLAPEHHQASYNLIPGFQLIDQDFVLRVDATGHHPKDSLMRRLLPLLASWLRSD